MKRRLPGVRFIAGLLAAGLCIPALLLILLASEAGSRWLINTLLLTADGDISVQRIDGTLLDRLTLTQLSYTSDTERITLRKFVFAWHPQRLFAGEVAVDAIESADLAIERVADSPPSDQQEPFSLPRLPLAIRIEQVDLRSVRYKNRNQDITLDRFRLSAALQDQVLTLRNVSLAMPELTVTGNAELSDKRPMSGRLNWTLKRPEMPSIEGNILVQGTLNELSLSGSIDGALRMTHQSRLDLSGETPAFTVSGRWQKLQWPLTGPAQAEAKDGRLILTGTPDAYRIEVVSEMAIEKAAPFGASLKGSGNTDSFKLDQLVLSPRQGKLIASGTLSWRNAPAFSLRLNATKLNTGDFVAGVPGMLNLQASASGNFADDKIAGKLELEALDGKLFESTIQGAGKLAFADQRLQIERLRLQSADNRLSATGILAAQRSNLDVALDAPRLAAVWPGLNGSISGDIKVRGDYQSPAVNAKLQASGLRYRDLRLDRLDMHLDYAEALAARSVIGLDIKGLQMAGQAVEKFNLQGAGSLANHHFQAALTTHTAKIDTALSGSLRKPIWNGTLAKLTIEHDRLKTWRLEHPWDLRADFSQDDITVNLPRNCLTHAASRFCLALNGGLKRRLQAEAEANHIDLAMAGPWLPENIGLTGQFDAKTSALKEGERWTADAEAFIPKASLQFKQERSAELNLPLSATRLSARYRNDGLAADLRIGLSGSDFISAQVTASPAPAADTSRLSGTLQASIADLTPVDALVPEIQNLKGRLTAELHLAGDTVRPDVSGQLQLGNASLDLPATGIRLSPIEVKLLSRAGQTGRLDLSGRIGSGKGSLQLSGHINLDPAAGFPAEVEVSGNAFEIAKLPGAEISISPRLTVKQADNAVQAGGEIPIDRAVLKLIEPPENAVVPSGDEVIVGQVAESGQKTPANVQADLGIVLKDNVRFSGFGIDTKLTGKLRYTAASGTQRMQGRVAMKEAKYKAYGQNLTIDKGEFLFNGPPDNPWLNFEATRKVSGEDITAVLTVTGPLQAPQTKVSSRPPLPESEALAYLLTGHSLQSASGSESEALAKAALSYGAGELSWLSSKLGVDQFEIEDSKTLKESALRLGKYINPNLYLGLTLGLFSTSYGVTLKQQLSKDFSLETRTGESQRLDLKYRLDKD